MISFSPSRPCESVSNPATLKGAWDNFLRCVTPRANVQHLTPTLYIRYIMPSTQEHVPGFAFRKIAAIFVRHAAIRANSTRDLPNAPRRQSHSHSPERTPDRSRSQESHRAFVWNSSCLNLVCHLPVPRTASLFSASRARTSNCPLRIGLEFESILFRESRISAGPSTLPWPSLAHDAGERCSNSSLHKSP